MFGKTTTSSSGTSSIVLTGNSFWEAGFCAGTNYKKSSDNCPEGP